MNLFHPHDPKISDNHRKRISPEISNTKFALEWLRTNPSLEDVRRAIILELESCKGPMHRGVLQVLLRRHKHLESARLEDRIIAFLKQKS